MGIFELLCIGLRFKSHLSHHFQLEQQKDLVSDTDLADLVREESDFYYAVKSYVVVI